ARPPTSPPFPYTTLFRSLEELPESAVELRYISVVVNDPEFAPYFEPGELARGSDVPPEVMEATRRSEAEQVKAAVGSGAPEVVRSEEHTSELQSLAYLVC